MRIHPLTLWSLLIVPLGLAAAELPRTVTFDTPDDLAKLHLENTNPDNISCELATRPDGNKVLRIDCKEGAGNLLFKPSLKDWTPFAQLRFTAHNIRNTFGYRIFSIKDASGFHNPDDMNLMPMGYVQLQPGITREFQVDLADVPGLDRKNVEAFALIWGTPETGLEIDNIRLLTKEQVEAEDRQEARNAIEAVQKELTEAARAADLANTPEVRTALAGLNELETRTPGKEFALAPELDRARRLAALLIMRQEAGAVPGEMAVLTADSTVKIFRESAFPVAAPVALTAGRNDSESFQLTVLPDPGKPLHDVSLTASALKSADGRSIIPADQVDLETVGYVQFPDAFYYDLRNGWWPDPLFANRPLKELAGQFHPFRVTVNVPAGTPPGVYAGTVTVHAADCKPYPVAYQLTVRRFTLPVRGELVTYFDFRDQSAWTPEMRRAEYARFLKYRLSPISMYGQAVDGANLTPVIDDLEFCRDRGQNNLVLWYLWNSKNSDGSVFDEAFLNRMRDSINSYRKRLEELGMWDMTMISCCDEAMFDPPERRDFRIAQVTRACEFIKKEIPGVRTSNIGPRLTIDENVMDSWFLLPVPAAESADLRAKGKFTGIYWAYESPSFMLDMAGIAPRICFWQAFKVGARGAGYYSTNRPWAGRQYAADAPEGVEYPLKDGYSVETYPGRRGRNGDGHLFYLNRDSSYNPSIRVANIRDGIQDYEYLALLRKLDTKKEYAALLNIPDQIVAPPVNYWSSFDRDPAALLRHREAVSQALDKLAAAQEKESQ